jgi:hypothetical protein
MNGAERLAKFDEFKRLHKAGQLKSHEIVSKLGISKNTLYNWRKRLKAGIAANKPGIIHENSLSSLFTRVISQNKPVPLISRFIEITIGSSITIRIPETVQPQSLQQIFAMISQWDSCK